jgi:DNA-binding transcriptional regulator of glucitol operon
VARFFTRHWVWLHIAVVLTAPGFIALGWWQVARAGAGNARSYGYAVEWPSLAAIVIFLYIRAIRMELRTANDPTPVPQPLDQDIARAYATEPVLGEEEDPELAAYNDYLRELSTRDLQRRR